MTANLSLQSWHKFDQGDYLNQVQNNASTGLLGPANQRNSSDSLEILTHQTSDELVVISIWSQ